MRVLVCGGRNYVDRQSPKVLVQTTAWTSFLRRDQGSGESIFVESPAEGVELISNILHRARSVAPIRTAVVRIDPRPLEGANGPRRPGAKNPSEGGQLPSGGQEAS